MGYTDYGEPSTTIGDAIQDFYGVATTKVVILRDLAQRNRHIQCSPSGAYAVHTTSLVRFRV